MCVFITAGRITKLFTWGEEIVEDMCYERRRARAEACVCVECLIGKQKKPILFVTDSD